MTVLFRCRVEPKLLKKAKAVSNAVGTSLEESVRMFISQIVRTKSIPVDLSLANRDDLVDVDRRNAIWKGLDESSAQDW